MKKIALILIAICIAATSFAQNNKTAAAMPENVAYYENYLNLGHIEGRSNNNAPTFFIYPHKKLDEAGAKALIEELDMKDILTANHTKVYVIDFYGCKMRCR